MNEEGAERRRRKGASRVSAASGASAVPRSSPRQGTFGGGTLDAFVARLILPQATLSAANANVNENTGTLNLMVSLSAAPSSTTTVGYATSNGSATTESDYTASSGTLTFPPGQTSLNASVPITNDAAQESSETVNLTLSSPTNATLGTPSSAVLTILDDETPAPLGDEIYQYDTLGNIVSKTGVGAYSYSASHPHVVTNAGGFGRGTTMTVRLPIIAELAQPGRGDGITLWLPALRILVVDDEPVVAESLARLLAEYGHHVILATDGESGLCRYREQPFDLVITDSVMPIMDGAEFVSRLRSFDPHAQVLAISGQTAAVRVDRMLEAGAFGFVSKPFVIDELLSAITRGMCERILSAA